jgi:hypothetical protein
MREVPEAVTASSAAAAISFVGCGAVPTDPTYYTIANARFFPGLVALLNSLRLTGNAGPLAVLDVGLTDEQRALLEGHATLHTLPPGTKTTPFLAKPSPHLFIEGGTIVIVDCDVIVTRDLGDIAARAEAGSICVYPDHPEAGDRWFATWEEAFELRAPLRRGRYLGAGLVALSLERWRWLLERWWQACEAIPEGRHFAREAEQPFWAGDQDALNALLLSEVPEGAVEVLPQDEAVLWDALGEVDVVDERTLECRYRGGPTALLHYSYRPKPWERRAWPRVTDDAFLRLLPRVLCGDDVELRLDPASLPLWARPGAAGRGVLRALHGVHVAAKAVINAPPAPMRRRLLKMRNELFYRLGR